MAVIGLVPHFLSYLITYNGHEDENGEWHEGYEEWSDPIPCHAVENGSASKTGYYDGSVSKCSFTIGRLPSDCRDFQIGERVKLNILGQEKEFTVKDFQRYQHQSKLWV